jgi:NAD(P)-dependent dehydrogenase (short-subunit alcohol dehydrogenase family)
MYGDQGIGVSALCPLAVETPMYTAGVESGHVLSRVMAANALLRPDDVADAVVAGLADGRFLILPHPEVADYYRGKAADPDGWLVSLRKVVRKLSR